jgi:predicted phage terminase large subunit-like protein
MILDGDGKIICGPFEGTTQPGVFWTTHPMNDGGAFIIALGQQSIWTPGSYHDHVVCRQAEDSHILGTRDPNRTYKRQGQPVRYGNIGVHHHGGYDLPRSNARNSNTLEYANHRGSFYNTTVGGQITGKGLDIGIVDDPIKGRAEANSKAVRDKTWDWFTDDFLTRFSDSAGLLIIMTRWHLDDPVGRLIERFPDAKILRYPAIAEEDEKNRLKGEALFPQHKSAMFLLERKRAMTEGSWQSEYQQNPIIVGGGIFPIDKLTTVPIWDHSGIKKSVRYWDKAATVKDDAAYTSGVLMHLMHDNRFVVEHVARGHWSAVDRERIIKEWAERDKQLLRNTPYEVGVEQEPGSGGKESAESTIRNLSGFRCFADKVTGSKEMRAEPFAAQVQGGNVRLIAGNWHYAYLDELESFPNGKFKDQVDASSGAFARLTSKPAYNLDAMAT